MGPAADAFALDQEFTPAKGAAGGGLGAAVPGSRAGARRRLSDRRD